MELPPVFRRHQSEIDSELRFILAGRELPLYDMIRYHLGWIDQAGRPLCASNGKAVRPTLCLLACQAVWGERSRALPAAAAVELVHNYSLVHDDIQDDDRERRHRPTVWTIWGKPQAINVGTAMRMLANLALRRLDAPVGRIARIRELLDEATISLIEGQYLDISYETCFDVSVADYLAMVGGKTAALFSCALAAGAELGSHDPSAVTAFREFGWDLGMAFQMRDDILGIWGREQETGKPSCNDIRRRKKTLPIVHALEKASASQRQRLLRSYGGGAVCETAVGEVMAVLEATGALDETQKTTEYYIEKARAAIAPLSLEPEAERELGEVVEFLGKRSF